MLTIFDSVVSAVGQLVDALGDVVTPAGAIVLLTLAVRGMLLPLGIRAARLNRARVALRPQELELRRKHASNPGQMLRELADLRQRHGVSQFATLLPLLAQLPFYAVLYRLFSSATINGHANLLLSQTFLGVPLSSHLTFVAPDVLVFAALLVLIAVVAWLSSRQTKAAMELSGPEVPGFLRSLGGLLPYGTMLVVVVTPLAATLYVLTSTAWSVAQRHVLGA